MNGMPRIEPKERPWWDRLDVQRTLIVVFLAVTAVAFLPMVWLQYRLYAASLAAPAVPVEEVERGWTVLDARYDEEIKAEIGGARIVVEPGSLASIPADNPPPTAPVEVRLNRGGIRLSVDRRRPDAPFVVRTPVGTAGVRGTRFSVRLPELLVMVVMVEEGRVEVAGKSGPPILIGAGEAGIVVDSAPARRLGASEDDFAGASAEPELPPWARTGTFAPLPPVDEERPAAEPTDTRVRHWSRLPNPGGRDQGLRPSAR